MRFITNSESDKRDKMCEQVVSICKSSCLLDSSYWNVTYYYRPDLLCNCSAGFSCNRRNPVPCVLNPGYLTQQPTFYPSWVFQYLENSIQDTTYERMRELNKREWIKELEKQREEQKQRKKREKELDDAYFRSDDDKSLYNCLKLDSASPRSRLPLSSTYSLSSASSIPSIVTPSTATTDESQVSQQTPRSTTFLVPTSRTQNVTESPSLQEIASTTYIENRILTPSRYRGLPSPMGREIGTQTDLSVPVDRVGKRDVAVEVDDTEPPYSNRSSAYDDRSVSRHSVASSKKQNAEGRPKWGINQPERTYTKQSEKDPVYERKRKAMQEARRRRLEQEAAIQRERPVVGGTSSGKTRSNAQQQKSYLGDAVSLHSNANSFRPISESSSSSYPELRSDVDTPNTDGSLTRRQRRQWSSAGNEELVQFYNNASSQGRKKQPSPTQLSNGKPDPYYNGNRPPSPPVPALLHREKNNPPMSSSLSVDNTGFVPYTRSSVTLGSRDPTPSSLRIVADHRILPVMRGGAPQPPVVSADGECQTSFHPPHFQQQLSRSSSLPNTSDVANPRIPESPLMRAGSSPYKRASAAGNPQDPGKLLNQLNSLRKGLLERQLEWERLISQQDTNDAS